MKYVNDMHRTHGKFYVRKSLFCSAVLSSSLRIGFIVLTAAALSTAEAIAKNPVVTHALAKIPHIKKMF